MIRISFEHNLLKKLPCPLYLLDISLLEFYLFGKIKSIIIVQEILDEIDLLEIVTQILNGISDEELQVISHSWIECVQNIINANRNYRVSKKSCRRPITRHLVVFF
jgi:CheY-specific phosphatase CheX